MNCLLCSTLALVVVAAGTFAADPPAKVEVGAKAPAFKITDANGKAIDLAELTAKGPVLLRLTCGCSGCDKELAYFQAIHESYKGAGPTSVAVFKEPDTKVAAYVKEKKLNMLYAVDTKGEKLGVFQTKSMPTNILIAKGGEIVAITSGCDPDGLIAKKVSEKIAKTLGTDVVDPKAKVQEKK